MHSKRKWRELRAKIADILERREDNHLLTPEDCLHGLNVMEVGPDFDIPAFLSQKVGTLLGAWRMLKKSLLACLLLATPSLADTYCVIYNATDFGKKETDQVANRWNRVCPHPVHMRHISFRDADNQAFCDCMAWLKRKVTKDDIVLIYLEGHGVMLGGKVWAMAPYKTSRPIFANELQKELDALPSKLNLMFIDSCNSGGAIKESWEKTVVVCATYENKDAYKGVMGPAVLTAFSKKADRNGDGKLMVAEVVMQCFSAVAGNSRIQRCQATPFGHCNTETVGIFPRLVK